MGSLTMTTLTPTNPHHDTDTDELEPPRRRGAGPSLRINSERLPSSPLIRFLRWWLPGIVCLIGVGIAVVSGFDDASLEALSLFVGAGTSIWLMNFLWRLGVSGDEDREREEAARVYLEEHGHWPEDVPGR
jgi:hypothetical protein